MASETTHRKLAANLSADVVGYSRPMAEDEEERAIRTRISFIAEDPARYGESSGSRLD
jgi:hypothetical protein